MNPSDVTQTNSLVSAAMAARDFFVNVPWTYVWSLTHDFVVAFDIALVAGLIYVLMELEPYRPHFVRDPKKYVHSEKKIATLRDAGLVKKWQAIVEKSESMPPQSLTLGIIEADSFVDDVLKRMSLPGEHMADRLDKLGSDLKTIDAVWKAHRVRNDVVHTPGYFLSPRDARKILKDYEAFLKELEVLE